MNRLGVVLLFAVSLTFAQDAPKPRVFITDSQSWETRAAGGGANGTWGAAATGGARPQTAEIIKTFGERCPGVMVNNIQSKTDYIVLLDHEGGKGYLQHRNKVAVFQRISGDTIVSKSTLSLGGSVQDACSAITSDFQKNGEKLRELAAKEISPAAPATQTLAVENRSKVQISVSSIPDAADIEVDGSFAGNTPSSIEVEAGEHVISVKKSGYKPWERKIKVSGGNVRLSAELEKQAAGN